MINNKKLIYTLSVVIFILFSLIIYLTIFIQPNITFTTQVNTVSNEDYKRIINNNQIESPNKRIEQFKHINVEIKVKTPFNLISNVKIDRDILEAHLKNNSKIQILSGGSFEHSNGKEYGENIEIYLNDIGDNELLNAIRDLKYKVKWKNIWRKPDKKIFYFKDYLQ
ncbi:hypothetical protein [Clostridium cylindrosporum]|uniref:Uncharacterized protein n=1 Tax=Clostridium cylindrosporum DSM 605 TaxID=1121307 RepID=A0A0J8D8K1_CLOCY|nr:hypothetical protein [Clostridium cylindrosporum]KMT22207.1 hypothetical protein CLCY_4c01800 [Clostridium cylindrosporum DSM 605]